MLRLESIVADPKQKDRLFWGLTLLMALLLVGGVLLPLHGAWTGLSDRIAQARSRLEMQQRFIARAGAIADEKAALEGRSAAGEDYLSGATDPLAAAELQTRLSGAVQTTGAQLISTQALPARADGGFRRIAARVTAATSPRQLRDLLHAIEAGRPRLLVTGMTLRTADAAGQRLEVSLDVAGFRPAGEGAP